MIKIILFSIGIICTLFYVIIFVYLYRGWKRIPVFAPKLSSIPQTSVAVIVAARNEEQHIEETIRCLLAQKFPKELTQITIIDDHSTDRTAEIVRSFEPQGVKLICLNEDKALNSYKKKAIATAIEETNAQLIITTDADCWMGENWMATIVHKYECRNTKMISAPVFYGKEKSFFETLQSLEFMTLIGLGAASIGNRASATCNGANLAYEREAFHAVGGFQGIDDLASGDDELLLHKISAQFPGSINFVKNKDAIVYTEAKPDLKSFIQQRRRWASKSTKYKNKGMVALGVGVWLFNATLLINLLFSFVSVEFLYVFIFQIVFKILAEFLFLMPITAFAGRKRLLFLVPILNLPHIIYIVYIGILGNAGKYQWKGREVK